MWASGFVVFCSLYVAKAMQLNLNLDTLDLHLKYGESLPDVNTLPELSEPIDVFVTKEAPKLMLDVISLLPSLYYMPKKQYIVLQKAEIPGLNLTALKPQHIEIKGLQTVDQYSVQWRLAKNRFDFNVTFPVLSADAYTAMENFTGHVEGYPNFSTHLEDVNIWGAMQYNIGEFPGNNETIFIDKVDIDLHAKNAWVIFNTAYGLNELRNIIPGVLNQSTGDISDAVLKLLIDAFNEVLRTKTQAHGIIDYLSERLPSDIPKNLLAFTRL